jgi:hypothetical protein
VLHAVLPQELQVQPLLVGIELLVWCHCCHCSLNFGCKGTKSIR